MCLIARRLTLLIALTTALFAGPSLALSDDRPAPGTIHLGVDPATFFEVGSIESDPTKAEPAAAPDPDEPPAPRAELERAARTVGLFAAVSLAPVAVLMATAFVRINIVLLLLRQAIGSPQVPGNQVITVLSLLLTALVMAPAAESVYSNAILPYADGDLPIEDAWQIGSEPIKTFMLDQIDRTGHHHYLDSLSAHVPEKTVVESDGPPLRVVAPAFLISELTTALWIGFLIYLPFLVVDLVVSAVLAATGLIMLPPTQVSLPLKLALFVLVDGWWLVADGLVRTFALGSVGSG